MSGPYFTTGAGPDADFNFNPELNIDPSLTNLDFSGLDGMDEFMGTANSSTLPTDTSSTPMDIPQDLDALFPPPTSNPTPSIASFGSMSMPGAMPQFQMPSAPPMMPAAIPPQIRGFAGPFWDPRTSGWTFMPLTPGPLAAFQPFPQPVGHPFPAPQHMPMHPKSKQTNRSEQENNKRKQSPDLSSLSSDSDEEPRRRSRKLSKRKRSRAARTVKSPSPIPDEDIFSSEDELAPKKGKGNKDFQRKRNTATGKKPSIAQTCVCGSAKTKIPRPRNMFILWRTQNLKAIQNELGTSSQISASKVAGERWKALPQAAKDEYARLAKNEAEQHARLYPDYKYLPKGKMGGLEDNKFGTASCTCGAYVANVRKSRAAGVELDRNVPDMDGYARVQPQAQAPMASMMAYPVYQPQPQPTFPVAPVNAFGLALPGQRRSPRNQSQTVLPTTETTDMDTEMHDADAQNRRRPSAILTPTNSPPAMNTRSRSISQEPETHSTNGWAGGEEPDWDKIFGADDDDDQADNAKGSGSARSSRKSSGEGRRRSPRHSGIGRGSSDQSGPRRSSRGSPRQSPK